MASACPLARVIIWSASCWGRPGRASGPRRSSALLVSLGSIVPCDCCFGAGCGSTGGGFVVAAPCCLHSPFAAALCLCFAGGSGCRGSLDLVVVGLLCFHFVAAAGLVGFVVQGLLYPFCRRCPQRPGRLESGVSSRLRW